MVLREIQVQLFKVFRTYSQDTESKSLPSVNLCKHNIPPDRRSIILHATLNGEYISVTGIYFDYLCTLLRNAPKAVPYKTLVKESQGYDVDMAEARDLSRWRIHELRKMIEKDPEHPQYILTVRGTGYRLAI